MNPMSNHHLEQLTHREYETRYGQTTSNRSDGKAKSTWTAFTSLSSVLITALTFARLFIR